VAADAGFYSQTQERAAQDKGVKWIAVLHRSTRSAERKKLEKSRWFKKAKARRTGCEGRISVIKRRHGLSRCRYCGAEGMKHWVGLRVMADNSPNIGMQSRWPGRLIDRQKRLLGRSENVILRRKVAITYGPVSGALSIAILRSLAHRYSDLSHSPKAQYYRQQTLRPLKLTMLYEGSSYSANRTARSAVIGFWPIAFREKLLWCFAR
jgi:hypothetical protein